MCSKPKLNSSEEHREVLRRHLKETMLQHERQHQYEQFAKIGRNRKWWQRLLDRIEQNLWGE